MKHVICISLLFFNVIAFGQTSANQWIDYSLPHYKFKITDDGVYRINQSDLVNAGISVGSLDPRTIQIFGRGEELALHVQGESDGSFDSNDFIEFYAQKNDGWFDDELYDGAANNANPYYSLITDTAVYFLTWGTTGTAKRLTPETDVNYGAYASSDFFYNESVVEFHSNYFDGKTSIGGATDPDYHPTEGWFDASWGIGGTRTRYVTTRKVFSTGPDATIEWVVLGASDYASLVMDHHLRVSFTGVTFDTIYGGYQLIRKNFQVAPSQLSNSNIFQFRSINDLGSVVDRNTVAHIRIKYPHRADLDNKVDYWLEVPDHSSQSKTYYDFINFNNSGTAWLYDLTNDKRVVVTSTSGNHEVLIPNGGTNKKCYIFSPSAIQSISGLRPCGSNGMFTNYTSSTFESEFLIFAPNEFSFEAQAYSSYRTLSGHSSVIFSMEEIYDQFAYGIIKHPLSIRNVCEELFTAWNQPPSFMMLLGKSVKAKLHRKDPGAYAMTKVPSYGNPASDILFTAGLNGTILEPAIATGRVSATTGDEVTWYLEKLKEYEANDPQPWMKNILHFAGGGNEKEADRFSSYLNTYESILEDTSFGGTTFTFRKSTTDPIQTNLSDSITLLINDGCSFMTFFGHASTTGGFDQNIDDPSTYENKGKYPLLVGNSCFTGDIHTDSKLSTSETFVLIKDKGVIGFLASVDLGFESVLHQYSTELFRNIGQLNYGGFLGESIQNTIFEIQGDGSNELVRGVCLQMTLHGDPALKINFQELPDYSIVVEDIVFDPAEVSTERDSFELIATIYNYGKAVGTDLVVEIERDFPESSTADTVYQFIVPAVKYRHELRVKMPTDPINGPGFNFFKVRLDPSSFYQELSKTNNEASTVLFIRSGNLVPVLPYNYALIPDEDPELISSTGYAFEDPQEYIMQIDTTDLFNSPALEERRSVHDGGVVKWKPQLTSSMSDSSVYFWRVAKYETDPDDIKWKEHSFQYIPGKRGWSQDHFFQWKENEYEFLDYNRTIRQSNFVESMKKLVCQTISTVTISNLFSVLYRIDSDLKEQGGCGLGPAIHIAVMDSLRFEPWGTPFQGQNADKDFGQLNKNGNCGKNRVQQFFIFNANNSSHLAGLKDMLNNAVPNGDYILAWTWVRNDFSDWDAIDPGMRQVFVNLGADTINQITNDSVPYIFFVKKGDPSTAMEVVGTAFDQLIMLEGDLVNNSTYGGIGSVEIGPASEWDSLHFRHYSTSNPQSDHLVVNVNGIDAGGVETNIIQDIPKTQKESYIGNQVNASMYPKLTLSTFIQDDSLQTAAQMDRWQVTYEGVMELALDPSSHYEFYNDTVQEGENLRVELAIQNISEYDADSVLIDYSIIDNQRNLKNLNAIYHAPIAAGETITIDFEFWSIGLSGENSLLIDVNPNFEQPEQTRFNNIGQIPFYVIRDNVNPLLDVTFDGLHIVDGEIVSAKPEILIQVADDNPFLIMDDTSDVVVYFTDPDGIETRSYFVTGGQDNMVFVPGSSGSNKTRVIANPQFDQDGTYGLRVQATDRSKNSSGTNDYFINFEVINKSTITHLLNYPNPFSTSTQFVFTLTGSQIPDNLMIQIMTISGKLVKTIYMDDLGPIRVGRNITDYRWDGRDEFGDKLANGVYLYTVTTRLNGGEIEHRSTNADKYFKKEFGKMYILR